MPNPLITMDISLNCFDNHYVQGIHRILNRLHGKEIRILYDRKFDNHQRHHHVDVKFDLYHVTQ